MVTDIQIAMALVGQATEPTMNVLIKELALIIAAVTGLISAIGVVVGNIMGFIKTNKGQALIVKGNELTQVGNDKTEQLSTTLNGELAAQKKLAIENADKVKAMAVELATLQTEKREALKAKEIANAELLAREKVHGEHLATIALLQSQLGRGSSDEIPTQKGS